MKTKSKFISSILAIFILTLTSCSEDTISDNEKIVKNTNELNISSRYSESESIKIVETIAKDLGANIKYDSKITKDNAIVFETEQEARDFIKKMQIAALDDDILSEETGSELTKVYYGSAMTTGFATLGFTVVTGSNGCISSVSGGWSGMTLGLGYSQGATHLGCHSATVCGTVSASLFFEGVGTVYSQNVCYNITIP
jgi:hypothetical protein